MIVIVKKLMLFVRVCFAAILVGCSSLNHHSDVQGGMEAPRVYPEVRKDIGYMVNARSAGGDGYSPILAPFLIGYSVIDIPFSFVVDTLYLPSDAFEVGYSKQKESAPTGQTNNIVH